MSMKSERKKQVKAEKQAEAALPLPPHKWYAEDAAEYVEEHRKHCTDPTCNNQSISFNLRGEKMVAMLYPQKLNEIFLAVYGTGTDADYQPFMSLQLANPEDIRTLFDADGNPVCFLCGPGSKCDHQPTCLAFTCHRGEGVVIAVESSGAVTIRCKTCGDWLDSSGVADEFQLAPRPKAEYPNLFCSRHGIQPGYAACIHVLEEGKHPILLQAASAEDAGQAWCEDCCNKLDKDEPLKDGDWYMLCQSSLDWQLHGQLKRLLAETGQTIYVPPSSVLNAPVASASVN